MGIAKDSLSQAQKQEIEQLRQFAARMGLTPLMNSTKWRYAIDAVTEVLPGAKYRCKLIKAKQEPGEWVVGFPTGLPLYNAIDWVEIDLTDKKLKAAREAITVAWQTGQIPHEMRAGVLRLTAYAKR